MERQSEMLKPVHDFLFCPGVSSALLHRGRVVYLGYGTMSFIPKLLLMQYTLQDAGVWRLQSVGIAGACLVCMLIAAVAAWCRRDRVCDTNFYILEDPTASRGVFQYLSYAALAFYLYPVLIWGRPQQVAEGLVVIIACYYLLWAPLMDASAYVACWIHAWSLLAVARLLQGDFRLDGPMAFCLVLYLVEGIVIRLLLRWCNTNGLKHIEGVSREKFKESAPVNVSKQQFLEAFARPTSSERFTSTEAFQRLLSRLQDQKDCVDALSLAFAVRGNWLHRRSLVRGQMLFSYHCICQERFRPDVMWTILEFVGGIFHPGQEDLTDQSTAASLASDSSLTSIEFVKRRLYFFLRPD